jgi:hypothetical protein
MDLVTNEPLNQDEYNKLIRYLAAILDRASKAELLRFDLEEALRLNVILREKINELEKE